VNEPITVIFFGFSGSGKGTQAQLLQQHLEMQGRKVFYIETGQRFRDFLARKNYSSTLTEEVIKVGGLLPPFLPIWIWAGIFIDTLTGSEDVIMDGLSRRPEEAPILDSALKFYKRPTPHVLFLDVSADWARARLVGRGRYDDTEDNISRRHAWFVSEVQPVLDFFKKTPGYHFHTINGEQPVVAVQADICKAIGLDGTH